MKFPSPDKKLSSKSFNLRKRNPRVRSPNSENELLVNNSHLLTLVISEHHVDQNDILPVFQKLYRTRNRACCTKVGNKVDCVAFWISNELYLQIDADYLDQLPHWIQFARKLESNCLDVKSPHVINFLVRNVSLADRLIQPAWRRLQKTPTICIPSHLVVSSNVELGSFRQQDAFISKHGPSLLDKYHPDQRSSWHFIFFEKDHVSIIMPHNEFEAFWELIKAKMPNVQTIEPEPNSQFNRKVVIVANEVKLGAQLTDTTSGAEIGCVIDVGNNPQKGWALILDDYSQDQCVMVNKESTKAQTAYIKSQ